MRNITPVAGVVAGITRWLQRDENVAFLEEGIVYADMDDFNFEEKVPLLNAWCDQLAERMDATWWLFGLRREVVEDIEFWRFDNGDLLWSWYDCAYEVFNFLYPDTPNSEA